MRGVADFLCGALLLLGVIPQLSAADVQLFSCGFETNFCGMTQSTDDLFDWTRHSGGTETGETGPSSAYSGTFYIYIDATEAASDYTADVATEYLQHSGTACVTFAYHMYGVGSGVLVVKVTSVSNEWRAFNDQGDHWRLGTTEVDLRPGDRVSFRAVTTSDSRGDIALDDIVIRTGGCRTTEPLPFSCSFEEGFCGMLQSNDDQFDWTRFDRATDTGPQEAAHGTWFIYMESDYPKLYGDVAKIETPFIDFTGHVCVRFKYYMSGYYVGVLSVHLVTVGTEQSIFRLGGNQWSEWQAAEINGTEIHSGDWLRFTGDQGLEPQDIGVDDVLISPGWCNGCQVNNGGCDHSCTGSGTCSCRQGYTLDGTNTCVDVNECMDSTHGCAESCHNTMGSYRCTCPDGMTLEADGLYCTDVDECLANKTCEQRCLNTVGAYSCGCHNGYILTDDKHRCKGCKKAYDKIVDADETFESTCPTLESLHNTPRNKCLLEACRRGVEVAVIRHEVCVLKACVNGDAQLAASAGSLGWDIFVLNLTWSESLDDQPSADQGHSDVPLWQVIIAVTVVVLAVIVFAVGLTVYLRRRKMASQAKEPDRVYYENDAALTTRPAGDVPKPADEAPYEDIDGPRPVTASPVQIQMSPPRADLEDPNPGGYEDLESYQPHVRGPYDVII